MADGPLAYFFWRVLDAVDCWLTQARLRVGGCDVAIGSPRRRLIGHGSAIGAVLMMILVGAGRASGV
jgi:hypothetical protein